MEEKSSLMKRVPELSCEEDQSKAKGWPKGQRVLTQARAACEFLVEFVLYPVVALASAILATSTYGQTFTLLALLGAAWWGLRQAIPKSVSKLRQTVVLLATLGLAYWAVEGFLNFRFTPDVRNKVMVIYCKEHWWPRGLITQGIFSTMKGVLGALHYGETHGAAAVRLHFVDRYYTDEARASPNYWGYYFDEVLLLREDIQLADTRHLEEVHFNQLFKRYGLHGGFNSEIDGKVSPQTYPLTYGLNRRGTNRLIQKYIHPQPGIQAKIDLIKKQVQDSDFAMGVHYRGTDTAYHWPYKKVPYEVFFAETDKAIAEGLAEAGLDPKTARLKIYVASDEAEFLVAMQDRYGGNDIVSYEGSPRLTPDQYAAATEGLTNSPDVHISNYEKGESAIIDAIGLAFGKHLIKGRSNVSEFSYAYNVDMAITQIFGAAKESITYIPKGQY